MINYLSRIDRSALLLIGVNVLSSISALATAYLYVIIFEPESRGVIVMISIISSIASSLLDFGNGITASRLYKRVENRNTILACLDVVFFAKLFLVAVLMVIVYMLNIEQFFSINRFDILMGLLGSVPIIIISSHVPILIHELELSKYISFLAVQAVIPLLSPSLIYFVFDCNDLIIHLTGIIVLNIMLALLTYLLLPRNLGSYGNVNIDSVKSLFSGSAIGYASLFNLLVSRGWYFWIAGNMGMHYVGIISLTQSIAERLSMIGDAFGQAGFRKALINKNISNVWRSVFRKLFVQSALISLTIAGILLSASDIIFTFLPDEYRDGALYLKIFLISYLFQSLYRVIHHMLLSTGNSRLSFYNYLISGFVLFVGLFIGEVVALFNDPLMSFLISSMSLFLFSLFLINPSIYTNSIDSK